MLFGSLILTSPLFAQIPRPSDVFGFKPGSDYKLASYPQMLTYFRKLDAASARVHVEQIGVSTLGNPLIVVFISSRENIQNLNWYRDISRRLALHEVDSAEAVRLSENGKAIVWIDGGLHASEVAGGQMTPLLAWKMATNDTPEMEKIRDRVILMLMPEMNPDGLKIVRDWYNKELGTPYETTSPPWLWHYYAGHDNNRDWYMNNLAETRAVTKVLYREWYPEIVYNHHQSAPSWARIFVPPFANPVNPNINPGVVTGVNLVGGAIEDRLAMNRMPGVISFNDYTMWWDGGMRTVPYFHNMIGILTETAQASATPRFYDPDSMPPAIAGGVRTDRTQIFYPYPWKGGESHLRDAVRYMMMASMAVLNLAADRKTELLRNIYRMAGDEIRQGKRGYPFAYIIPANQWDPGEARNLVDILLKGGVEVRRAEKSFIAGEKSYPAGSAIIYTAQPFRPYVIDLLDVQHYPARYRYPGGPPVKPYDITGWTLPFQMGVSVDRINHTFKAESAKINGISETASDQATSNPGYGYAVSHRLNNNVKLVVRLLESGQKVYETASAFKDGNRAYPAGTYIVPGNPTVSQLFREFPSAPEADIAPIGKQPAVEMQLLKMGEIGLYKSWIANIDEGWTRWLLKKEYGFVVDTLHDADIRNADLSRFSAVIIPAESTDDIMNGYTRGTMPGSYTGGVGAAGALALKNYVINGGTLITFDEASDFAIEQLGLPVRDVISDLSSDKFFIPGSLIRLKVDTANALAYGMQPEAAAFFKRSRAFETIRLKRTGEGGTERIKAGPEQPVTTVARYANDRLLMSGWETGAQQYLAGKAAELEVRMGKGRVILFGFRPQFRGQTRGTYKLIFNALLSE